MKIASDRLKEPKEVLLMKVLYIDVGRMGKLRADSYMEKIVNRFKSILLYRSKP